MMERLLPSKFSYDDGCTIRETTETTEDVPEDPAAGEKVIISILKKYGFLTLLLISRNTAMKHRTINVAKSIRKMQHRGLVRKYTITYDDSDIADTDIYILSQKGIDSSDSSPEKPYRMDMTNIPYILEQLSVAQWHMAVLSDRKAQEVMYQHTVRTGGNIVMVPSLIRYRTGFGRTLHICALPVEKGKHRKDLGRFVAKLLLLNSYLSENHARYRSYIIVISCESQRQAEEIAEILGGINETREIYCMYTVDSVTADEGLNPLSMLYDVRRNGKDFEAGIVSLH